MRYRPSIARGAAAAAVSVFLVAGGAFAADAVFTPGSPDAVPGITLSTDHPSETAEPTGTVEPLETPEPTGTPEVGEDHVGPVAAGPASTAEPKETAEPSETPYVEDHQGDDDDNDEDHGSLTASPDRTSPTQSPESSDSGHSGSDD
jgi:hypothetical protein